MRGNPFGMYPTPGAMSDGAAGLDREELIGAATLSANRAVEELRGPIETALRLAAQDGDLNRYTLVVVDDASGRIPARMVWRALKTLRLHSDARRLDVAFLPGAGGRAGGRSERKKEIAGTALSSRRADLQRAAGDGRALIVTDFVWTGDTVAAMAQGLHSLGIECDVIAACGCFSGRVLTMLPEETHAYTGSETLAFPRVDGNHRLAGVEKSPSVHAMRGDTVTPFVRAARLAADRAALEIAAALQG